MDTSSSYVTIKHNFPSKNTSWKEPILEELKELLWIRKYFRLGKKEIEMVLKINHIQIIIGCDLDLRGSRLGCGCFWGLRRGEVPRQESRHLLNTECSGTWKGGCLSEWSYGGELVAQARETANKRSVRKSFASVLYKSTAPNSVTAMKHKGL